MNHIFRNDYSELIHPRILKALEKYSLEQNLPYGLDEHSKHASELIKETFNAHDAEVHFLAGGTQTNMVFISSCLKHFEGVIAVSSGHINVHETAAIESAGYKIFTLEGKNGKLYPKDVLRALYLNTSEHMVKPKLVYISNSTEIGTIYTKQELIDLHEVCEANDLYLFIDGARLGSALTSKDNDVDPKLLGSICDAFYAGGTKNGLMFGEALVINNKSLQKDFRYHIKNKGAMLAKGYALGIQFEEAFKDGLYFELAKTSNEMASYLQDGLLSLGIDIIYSPTNQIFASFTKEKATILIKRYSLEKWDEYDDKIIVRFVTSFTTKKEHIDELLSFISNLIK